MLDCHFGKVRVFHSVMIRASEDRNERLTWSFRWCGSNLSFSRFWDRVRGGTASTEVTWPRLHPSPCEHHFLTPGSQVLPLQNNSSIKTKTAATSFLPWFRCGNVGRDATKVSDPQHMFVRNLWVITANLKNDAKDT